ncbi:MAG: glutamate dehydrogenase, partial [Kiritimatiellia bacterium]
PPDLIMHHILQLEVDLLWNGGIGTYVMASNETNADADDRSNDTLRVKASQLRALIVGEGGNLGFTQEGRIEAGRNGVRLNTDAIDNSGGVDMSDHEVNLKILLNGLVEAGEMDVDGRNTLLEALTDEVADLVLGNNNAHGRQLSRDQIRSRLDIFQFGHAISFVERTFGIRRESLDLPNMTELAARAVEGEGLTRPELAVLGAYVKMYVYKQLMSHAPKETPGYEELLLNYFPKEVAQRFPDAIRGHMLADEIAMTVATTKVIADGGAALIPIMIETTGASVPLIVTAFLKAQRLGRIDEVRSTLEELRTSVSLKMLNESFVRCIEGTRMMSMFWLSARGRIPTDEELSSMLEFVDRYDQLLPAEALKLSRRAVETLHQQDVPQHVAELIVKSRNLNLAVMAWALSRREGEDLARAIIKLQAVGRGSRLLGVIEDLAVRPASGQWEPIALRILFIRFLHLLRTLIPSQAKGMPIESVDQLQPLLEENGLGPVRAQVDDLLNGEEVPSPATLLVLEERVAAVMSRMS